MRVVIQRVTRAALNVEGQVHSSIGPGLVVLLGVEEGDGQADVEYLVAKLCGLRIFADADGKMNLDILQVKGELMVVSQFTLHASTRKGNRPSFVRAAAPDKAIPLYNEFLAKTSQTLGKGCKSGVFGAYMQVELVNDGPVTILMDSKSKE
jgi:D-aminoacyl-tRNA deacylase